MCCAPRTFCPWGAPMQCARGAPGASGDCPRSSSLTSWRPGSSRRHPGSSRRYAGLLQGAPRVGWPERRSSRCPGSSPVGGHSHRELAGVKSCCYALRDSVLKQSHVAAAGRASYEVHSSVRQWRPAAARGPSKRGAICGRGPGSVLLLNTLPRLLPLTQD